jgi:hypothetical protein
MNLYKLYLLIGYPAAAKYDPDYAFGPVGSKVWENNPSWRSKGGGPITPRSMSVAPERSKAIVTAMLKKGGAAPLA